MGFRKRLTPRLGFIRFYSIALEMLYLDLSIEKRTRDENSLIRWKCKLRDEMEILIVGEKLYLDISRLKDKVIEGDSIKYSKE